MRWFVKSAGRLGWPVLGIWLILMGLVPLARISFPSSGTVMALPAIIARLLILAGG